MVGSNSQSTRNTTSVMPPTRTDCLVDLVCFLSAFPRERISAEELMLVLAFGEL